MFNIVLYGGKNSVLTLTVCRALSEYGGVLYFGKNGISEYGSPNPEFVLTERERLESINARNTVLVFKSDARQFPEISEVKSTLAIAESENRLAADFCAASGIALMTCGAGKDCSFTPSSLETSNAYISLNSAVPLLPAGIVEPREIPIKRVTKAEGFPLLCACALLILCGKFNGDALQI